MELQRCRLCLSSDSPKIDVFNESACGVHKLVYALFKFRIKQKDLFPKEICIKCIKLVKEYHNFTVSVKEAQIKLQQYKVINTESDKNQLKPTQNCAQIDNCIIDAESIKQELRNDALETNYDNLNMNYMHYDDPPIAENVKEEYQAEHNNNFNLELQVPDYKPDQKFKNEIVDFPTDIYKDGKLVVCEEILDNLLKKFYNLECAACSDKPSFESYTELFKHSRRKHKKRGVLICCNKKFTERKFIISHMVYHLQPSAFQCTLCRKVMNHPDALAHHVKTHRLPCNPHQCNQCTQSFLTVFQLSHHQLTKHDPDHQQRVLCPVCHVGFSSKEELKEHTLVQHKDAMFLCPFCGRNFLRKSDLTTHLQLHTYSGTNTEECPVCGLKYKNSRTLRAHMKRHTGARVQCEFCEYSTVYKKHLLVHFKSRHCNEKPFVCSVCNKAFKLKRTLQTHAVQHTGEHKYLCKFCSRTFAQSSNLIIHRRRMHPEEHKQALKAKAPPFVSTNCIKT